MGLVYNKLKEFKSKYPSTVAWRMKQHAKVVEKYLNPGEEVRYAFPSQKGPASIDMFFTVIVVLTNKRILLAHKNLLFGYTYLAITPDMFNDLTVSSGIIWSKIFIDTVKETVILSNISKNATDDIETEISEYMLEEKRKYVKNGEDR